MTLTTSAKRKLATIGSVTTMTVVFGSIYPCIFVTPEQTTGAPLWHSILNGLFVGLFVGIALSLGELYLFQSRLRRLRFSAFLVAQTFYYLTVLYISTIGVLSLHMVVFHELTFAES
ncbi:MAG: hypothetical protein HW412_1331, partial [Bacteroidetes bacterium]|nr:hypothetical protein [Bacteroidota bacterium]